MKRPTPFGKYFLLDRVNVGGMAEVFRAKTFGVEGFERFVAVKRILPNIAEDEEFISMFIDEAKIAVQLNHANIAQIFDLGKVDESYFIALEYVHGKDLRAIYDRCQEHGKPQPIPQACFVTMKVCEGLDYAHNKRDSTGQQMHLVHRDVSPQNVLISYDGEVKLVDFGIAKAVGKASKTQAGILKGKFGYMSPEQVRGLPLDRRSDIFSVGIVLYELLTGERLFLGESDFSTLEKVRNVEILPPSTYNRKIPDELEQIVLKALARDVDDRYEYAIDLHDDLQAFMYSSGAFYARKDLAAWMKETFATELEEESRKMEEFRKLEPPSPVSEAGRPSRATGPRRPPPPPPGGSSRPGGPPPPPLPTSGSKPPPPVASSAVDFGPSKDKTDDEPIAFLDSADAELDAELDALQPLDDDEPKPDLDWDDDEIETQIYDKPASPASFLNLTGASDDEDDDDDDTDKVAASPSKKPDEDDDPLAAVLPAIPATATVQVDPLPAVGAVNRAESDRRRGGKTGLWIALVAITMLVCGGALYYFLVLGHRPGSIRVEAHPSDVTVFLDGVEQKSAGTPLTLSDLKPGFYIVMCKRSGHLPWQKEVEVAAGQEQVVRPRLEAKANGQVKLYANEAGATVILDNDRLKGITPMKITRIRPGKHTLRVEKESFKTWVTEFEIEPDQTLELTAKLVKLNTVDVQVASEPAGEVFVIVDGKRESKGTSPVKLSLDPAAKVQVAVKAEGYLEQIKDVKVVDGKAPELSFALKKDPAAAKKPDGEVKPSTKVAVKPQPRVSDKPRKPRSQPRKPRPPQPKPPQPVAAKPKPVPPPPPPPAGDGTLVVGSRPLTQVIIDGRATGKWTPAKFKLPAGPHKVTLVNTKFSIEKTFTVTVNADKTKKFIRKFEVQ